MTISELIVKELSGDDAKSIQGLIDLLAKLIGNVDYNPTLTKGSGSSEFDKANQIE